LGAPPVHPMRFRILQTGMPISKAQAQKLGSGQQVIEAGENNKESSFFKSPTSWTWDLRVDYL
jgi:hypothetical protein